MRRIDRAARLLALLLLAGGLSCGGGDGGSNIVEPGTPEELTSEGWTEFEQGDFGAAMESFDAAIKADATYGPAYVGKGWTHLSRASGSTELATAIAAFENASQHGETGADLRAGRAAAALALGSDLYLSSAITDAQAARLANPSFIFSHRPSFNVEDLVLVEAFALAGKNQIAQALDAANQIQASSIEAGNPVTWTIGGVTYPSFESAVLAFLQKLSNERSG
ncbi:MAG: hypothetical protein ACE15D_18305 [Candidatus Eisenbacteria bacterium]|nr:hypothetical protein [Candidatus Eisenbacteria bacterium]